MRGLRRTVVGGVIVLLAAAAASLILAGVLFSRSDWVLGVLLLAGALISMGASFGILRGFRPLISKQTKVQGSPPEPPRSDNY